MVRVKVRRRPRVVVPEDSRNKRRMTVDPGIDGSGVAVWEWDTWYQRRPDGTYARPIYTDVFAFRIGTMESRLEAYFASFQKTIEDFGVQVVIVEWPEFFHSAKGFAAAAAGDLTKLTGCATAAMAAAWSLNRHASAVPVRHWKGQMPKSVVEKHVKRLLGRSYPSHSGDAVGIGLHLQGAWDNG